VSPPWRRAIWNIDVIIVLEHAYQKIEDIVEVVVKWAHLINLVCEPTCVLARQQPSPGTSSFSAMTTDG
jgi:hypothetical protein